MMNLRKLAILGIVGLASAATVPGALGAERQRGARAGARDGAAAGARTGDREQFLERILEQLDLTADQKTKIQPIMQEAREKIRTAVQSGDREAARTEMRSAVDQVRAQLNPEQQTKLRELMRERMAGAATQPGMAQMDIVQRMRQAVSDLNLTDDQKSKLEDIFKTFAAQIADIRKAAGDNQQSAQEQIRPLRADLLEKVKAILTPEQSEKLQAKIDAFRESGPGNRDNRAGDRPARQGNRQRNRQGAQN